MVDEEIRRASLEKDNCILWIRDKNPGGKTKTTAFVLVSEVRGSERIRAAAQWWRRCERGMRHNINIIFKRRARSHYHNGMHRKLGCLAGVRAFQPLRVSVVVLEALGSGAKRAEKGLLRRWHRRDRSPVSFSHVLAWWMRPGVSPFMFSRERSAISVLRTFRTRVSVSLHLRSPVCRAISLDATRRDFSRCVVFPLCFSRRCVNVDAFASNWHRLMPDLIKTAGVPSMYRPDVTSLPRCYANWNDWIFLILLRYTPSDSLARDRKLWLRS